ncbi:23S rRNA (pseudouridine(1915)-N(3))-methyltransferase RlmH, partial [Enterococcus faecium]|uniref:23S rRNA (pseudouridine(1915)-N(3))-methyltransferase RlmH n=1 Tax=Enterococcus faecium TaxID=1352 RepID=UPI003AADA5E3
MKILFLSIGKTHESYIQVGVSDFTQRINKYFKCDWQIIAPPKNAASLSEADLKNAEGKLVLGL